MLRVLNMWRCTSTVLVTSYSCVPWQPTAGICRWLWDQAQIFYVLMENGDNYRKDYHTTCQRKIREEIALSLQIALFSIHGNFLFWRICMISRSARLIGISQSCSDIHNTSRIQTETGQTQNLSTVGQMTEKEAMAVNLAKTLPFTHCSSFNSCLFQKPSPLTFSNKW